MRLLRSSAVLAALLVTLASPALPQGTVFGGKPATLLEQRGLPMSYQEAVERVTFHPFVPTPSYVEVALLPAFHGDDKDHPENRGVGFEYVSSGHTYVLREWPLAGGSLDKYPSIAPEGTCTTGHFTLGTPQHMRAIAWTGGMLVFALQPDIDSGKNADVPAMRAEWLRLVKRGACR